MKARDLLGYLLVALGLAGVTLGGAAAAREMPLGWGALFGGVGVIVVAHRAMTRAPRGEATSEEET